MILKERKPEHAYVAQYIDRYQFYKFHEPCMLKGIPNGKIELYLVLAGQLEIWDQEQNTFIGCGEGGIFPISKYPSFYRVADTLDCINIKLNLNVLSLNPFQHILKNWKMVSPHQILGTNRVERIRTLTSNFDWETVYHQDLDHLLAPIFKEEPNQEIATLLKAIQETLSDVQKVSQVAKKLHISIKTLERRVKKYFHLTPKDLFKVLRFENTSIHLNNKRDQPLIDALEFGYYDQSHFNKDCKMITGEIPSVFFSKLILPTNDLILEKGNQR